MPKRRLRIALDFSTLDHLTLGNGQYRYVVDLIRGLSTESNAEFIVYGSLTEPVPEIRDVLAAPNWSYRQVTVRSGRFGYVLQHLRYGWYALRDRVDIWHAFHSFVSICCLSRIVITEHDLMYHLYGSRWQDGNSKRYQFHRFIVKCRAACVICISECTKRDLLEFFPMRAGKAVVIYHGTELQNQAPGDASDSAVLQLLRGKTWISSPFNLEPRKNLRSLLLGFQLLRKDFPNLELVLFGNAAVTSEREQEYDSLVDQLNLRSAIHRTGFISNAELAWVYQNSLAFIFPSLYEGFGLPILEAMANGTCVVARSESAMAEIVADTGILVETNDPSALRHGIASLLSNPARRTELANKGYQRAIRFSVARMADETKAVYLNILGRQQHGFRVDEACG